MAAAALRKAGLFGQMTRAAHRVIRAASALPRAATPHDSNKQRTPQWQGLLVGAAAGSAAAMASGCVALCDSAGEENGDSASRSSQEVVLYRYQPCPFCNKVAAYLDYAGINWKAVEVDPLFKKEMESTGFKKVPVVHIEGKGYMCDSDTIIDHLIEHSSSSEHTMSPHAAQTGTLEAALESQWRSWVNDRFVHIVTANIYNTWGESVQTFDYLTTYGNFPKSNQLMSTYVGAAAMFALSKLKLNKKHGITSPREELYNDCNSWIEAVGDHRFLGNDLQPTLADLGVFGVLRAIRDYDTFEDLMANTEIGPWYFRVADAVGDTTLVAEA